MWINLVPDLHFAFCLGLVSVFNHMFYGYSTDTEKIVPLSRCQWSNSEFLGELSYESTSKDNIIKLKQINTNSVDKWWHVLYISVVFFAKFHEYYDDENLLKHYYNDCGFGLRIGMVSANPHQSLRIFRYNFAILSTWWRHQMETFSA